MVDVVVISDTIVRPESYEDASDRVKIHLTPWDLSFLRTEYAQRALIFPKPTDQETHMISRLKSSLSAALNIFFPYAGRLVMTDNEEDKTRTFYVDCDGSGVKFVHAAAVSVSVSDVLELANGTVPNDCWSQFFPANGVESWEGVSKPLIAFQVTELKDGVLVGYGYNHMVADGPSFWSFFKTWTEIFSTGGKKFPPLSLRGWFLDGIDYPIRVPISETVPPSHVASYSSLPEDLQKKIFRFTSIHISNLKEKANYEVVGSDDEELNISSFQAVLGHMWRSIIRNSDLNPEEVIHCTLAMDIRHRLNPPVEKECFGNMIGLATATTTVGEMLSNGLGWAALQLNKTVRSQTNEELRRFAENWVKNPKIPKRLVVNNSLFVGSSPRFNVFENDFGWGKPIAVRGGPGIGGHGRIIAYPGTEKGSMEIHTSLRSHVMEKLLADEEFLQHVVTPRLLPYYV